MNLEKYEVSYDEARENFKFISIGDNGSIVKVVSYQKITDGLFNLAFGDWDDGKMKINARVRSNNGDRQKILATVATTVLDFLHYHSGAIVQARGNTPSKTRLYRMGINYCYSQIGHLFEIKGLQDNEWQVFQKNKNYQAFSITQRQNF